MRHNSRYYILDPSVFVSIRKIKEIFSVLDSLSQPTIISTERVSVVIPSDLYDALYSIKEGEKPEQHYETLTQIFSRWLTFYDKYHVELIVKQLLTDKQYRETLGRFLEAFKPVSGEEFIKDEEKIGEETVHLGEVVEKLGDIVGRLVFEILALSHRLRGLVVSFGQRLASLMRKLKITVVTVHSEFKKRIKQHSKIRSLLRISLYAITTESLHRLIDDLQISDPELHLAVDIAGFGVFVIADG